MKKAIYIITASFLIAAAMIGSSYLLSRFILKIQRENTISAKGYAEKLVRSDVGRFNITVSVDAPAIAEGAQELAKHIDTVLARLRTQGFGDSEITVGGVNFYEVKKLVNGKETNQLDYYTLNQSVEIYSNQVDLIQKQLRSFEDLLADDIKIQVSSPEYYISNLESYKLELTDAATRSAAERARVMADRCGAKVKQLLSAKLGVIQITRPASADISDSGSYDTSSPDKVIKAVVSLEFAIK